MKSSTARLKISGCSQYGECPASGMITNSLFGTWRAIMRMIEGGVTRSAVPVTSNVGTLSVKDVPGRGCIFTIDLPGPTEKAVA